jgi:hypothetical protein
MRNVVSPKTLEIITRSESKAADPGSTGLTRAKLRRIARFARGGAPEAGVELSAVEAHALLDEQLRNGGRVLVQRRLKPNAREAELVSTRPATGRAGKANVGAVLELAAGAMQLATVSAAYGKAMKAAGKGEAVSIPPAAIDAGAALLALLRRYRAKR